MNLSNDCTFLLSFLARSLRGKADEAQKTRQKQTNASPHNLRFSILADLWVELAYRQTSTYRWRLHGTGHSQRSTAIGKPNLVYLGRYQAGDIVVFKHDSQMWYVRIIALAGDTVQLQENQLLVNDLTEKAPLPRNWQGWQHGTYAVAEPYRVPPNHVFVLLDKLAVPHDDSRVFGPTLCSAVTGVVW